MKFNECRSCDVMNKSVCGVCVKEADNKKPRYWTIDREKLIEFCVSATADLHGVKIEDVEPARLHAMSDMELVKEADWLDELLGK